MNVETNVLARYSLGAQERQPALCCPVTYDQGRHGDTNSGGACCG